MTHVQSMWTAVEVYQRLEDLGPEDVKKLEDWCQSHPAIVPQSLNEEQLILFLHSCYNNLDNAIRCMTSYYHIRRKATQLFNDRDIERPEIQKALKVLNYGIIKPKTPANYKIIFHSLQDPEPSQYCFNDGFKLLAMAMDAVYIREGPNPGIILLFDMAGVKLGHVARLPLGSVKRCLEYIQDANPVRLKGVHVINVHPVIDKIMVLVRPFIRKQLMSLLHFHKEFDDSLYEVIPKSCLPSDYGGEAESIEQLHKNFVKEMINLRPLYLEEDKDLAEAFKVYKENKQFGIDGDKEVDKEIDLKSLDID